PLFSFFFNDTATTDIYPLSLHDALPIYFAARIHGSSPPDHERGQPPSCHAPDIRDYINHYDWNSNLAQVHAVLALKEIGRPKKRSEEHTSELQSRGHLVCRLLLEKKK